MDAICTTILNCIGPYPTIFSVDHSPYRNCYAHALNCMFEDRDYSVYSPGAITAVFNGSDCFTEDGSLYFREDLSIKLVTRDCSSMKINAFGCSYDSKLHENESKIALTYSKADNDFHFLRQNADGSWSHKPGWGSRGKFILSELIAYNGESVVEICGKPYKVFEILKLQKRVGS